MPLTTAADLLAETLYREGVNVVFGIPGVQTMDAVDAIHRAGKIRWLSTRHEQTAAYMAYGYARASGKIGVAMVLPGPGALNAAAAIGTAYTASTPVLLISGQIESYHIGHHRGVLHEFDRQTDVFRTITKWSGRAAKADDVPALLQQALVHLKTGRPRPVEIEVPYDLWSQKAEMSVPEILLPRPVPPNPSEISQAVNLLSRARRPLILAGNGAANPAVAMEIIRLSWHLNAPVVMTTDGQGVVSTRHPLYAGNFALWRNPFFEFADVVLAVGARLRAPGSSNLELRPDQDLIRIEFGADEMDAGRRVSLDIKADIFSAMAALNKDMPEYVAGEWRPEEIVRLRDGLNTRLHQAAPFQLGILDTMYEVLPDDAVIVSDITNLGYWNDIAYPVERIRCNIDASYFATLGYAFPTALGAKLAAPDHPVIAICGDGGFPYASPELATAVQEGINVIVLLFTDNAYGTVTGIQKRQYGGRYVGNLLRNPDYVKFAESFGAIGVRLSSPDGLGPELRRALDASRPVLIEIPVPQLDTPWDVL